MTRHLCWYHKENFGLECREERSECLFCGWNPRRAKCESCLHARYIENANDLKTYYCRFHGHEVAADSKCRHYEKMGVKAKEKKILCGACQHRGSYSPECFGKETCDLSELKKPCAACKYASWMETSHEWIEPYCLKHKQLIANIDNCKGENENDPA